MPPIDHQSTLYHFIKLFLNESTESIMNNELPAAIRPGPRYDAHPRRPTQRQPAATPATGTHTHSRRVAPNLAAHVLGASPCRQTACVSRPRSVT
jgi:hypothetical protein